MSTKELFHTTIDTVATDTYRIVLFNDDYNTFPWVIQCLVEVCDHTATQAEQCAWIVHHKGKYIVKSGDREDMGSKATTLSERGLTVEVV